MSAPLELSLVIPVYNERDNLPVLVEEIGRALAGRGGGEPYEIVAVDDGSTDGSLDVLKALKREHPEIHIVAFARSEEHTSELQSHSDLVCRLLLEKKKNNQQDQS